MKPNWKPLEDHLGRARCVGFMFMGRINGINLFKHGIARLYLALDDRGQCLETRGHSSCTILLESLSSCSVLH